MGELCVRAAREATSLVTTPDLQTLASLGSIRVRPRFRLRPSGPSAETSTLASQASAFEVPGHRAQDVELRTAVATSEELRVGVDPQVGRLRRRPPAWLRPVAASRPGMAFASVSPLQTETRASAIRRSNGVRSRRPARANQRALDHGALILGEHTRQAPAAIVEPEEAPGIEAGRLVFGLVASGLRELPDLLG